MKLVHGDLSGEIVNEQKECVEWIIESPELFSKYVGELYKQANKDEGEFVLSENNKEIDIAKYSEIDFGKTPRAMADDILNVLLVEGKVVKIAEDMYTLTEYMEEAKNIIREKLAEDPVITIAQVRDIFATSRKSAKPILEYMDSIKVTKKVGAESERVAY